MASAGVSPLPKESRRTFVRAPFAGAGLAERPRPPKLIFPGGESVRTVPANAGMQDSFERSQSRGPNYRLARRRMVERLEQAGCVGSRVAEAMRVVPRHQLVPEAPPRTSLPRYPTTDRFGPNDLCSVGRRDHDPGRRPTAWRTGPRNRYGLGLSDRDPRAARRARGFDRAGSQPGGPRAKRARSVGDR